MLRTLVVLLVTLVVVVVPQPAAALVLQRPVDGRVAAPFAMTTRYGPGHRGVDLAAWYGTPVRAAGAGTVTFAGSVVGALWVTVDHGPVRTTVGPLASVTVGRGARVRAGEVLGTSGLAHGRARLHWSARVGDRYVDPLRWTVRRTATLVPTGHPTGVGPAGGRRAQRAVPWRVRVR